MGLIPNLVREKLRNTLGRLRGDGQFNSFRSDVGLCFEQLRDERKSDRARLDALATQIAQIATSLPAFYQAPRKDFATQNDTETEPIRHGLKGIFIVGHARTGTSILLEALNSSRDIFMFGEATVYLSSGNPKFQSWYNQMHNTLGNPRRKGLYCPERLSHSATVLYYVKAMSKYYKLVGDKIAFRDKSLGYDHDLFIAFQTRHFLDSKDICTMRHPAATLESNSVLFGVSDLSIYVRSYVKTLATIIEITQIMLYANVLIFEYINANTFIELSHFLDCDLADAALQYDISRQVMPKDEWNLPGISSSQRDILLEVWDGFLAIYDKERLSIIRDSNIVERFQQRLIDLMEVL